MRVWPGSAYPLGAHWDGEGVNFALFSSHATRVELCLFDRPDSANESRRIRLTDRTDHVWHGYFPDLRPGQLYAYRVYGPYSPEAGHRFNHNKLLLDPYAKLITGRIAWSDAQYGYCVGHASGDLSFSDEDSAPEMPRCVVVDPAFTWGDDRPPRTPWTRTLIYECHVKGMTARHPEVPPEIRGTYTGLASDPIVDHLLALGVTAVELLPIQHMAIDRPLLQRGLTNYWGYNTIGYFAPDPRFSRDDIDHSVNEFKSMVKAFHRVGIEVILDVVYNHTGEGSHLGPTICFRGIDNATYYHLEPERRRYYRDYTGCGNSLDLSHPRVLQLVLDSLRYWVEEMHVDGFRFDLATTLARDPHDYARNSRFLATVMQDPILRSVKLIAEPWDLGHGGYQLGQFPGEWAEWNDRYRDTVRRFWRGDTGQIPEVASRVAGSSDLFQMHDRRPHAGINYVTCHDGFTLHDLVTYANRHNHANGEDNRDGTSANWNWNWGCEGETSEFSIVRRRDQTRRNLLATLAFSQGVPMLSHGDEIGRTQRGNNNAYCQDNEITWLDWKLGTRERELLEFARKLFALRRENPVFWRRHFFAGDPVHPEGVKDVTWMRPDGTEMLLEDWRDPECRVLGALLHGDASDEVDERGRTYRGDSLLLLLNGGSRSHYFRFPTRLPITVPEDGIWRELIHTAGDLPRELAGPGMHLNGHSLVLLRYETRAE